MLKLDDKDYNFFWVILTAFGYLVFTYLTYFPIKTQLFFDTKDEVYGIKK